MRFIIFNVIEYKYMRKISIVLGLVMVIKHVLSSEVHLLCYLFVFITLQLYILI